MLIMEFVSYGTLRSFLQTHQDKLNADPEIQNLFAIASYHVALAMEHLRSKMVSFCFSERALILFSNMHYYVLDDL